ncbi:MAG: DUF4129 domain-containing protein [Candidatus Bathyarchaeia archaeon]
MSGKNAIVLSVLLTTILILTVSVVGAVPKSPVLGGLAPVLILTIMTWYLIVLIVNRDQIIAALAAMFKLQREPKPRETNFWLTVAAYAALFGLGIIAIWTGLPQRILTRLQGMAVIGISGIGNTSAPRPQLGPIAGLLPTTPILYYGILITGAIVAVSFTLILGGIRLAYRARGMRFIDSQVEVKEQAAELVQETITSLKSTMKYHEIILQCYKRMCEVLSSAGLEPASEETAREFAENISSKLQIGKEAVTGLTFLFEEARYSNHEISEEKRITALSHLQFLQQALSANVGGNK